MDADELKAAFLSLPPLPSHESFWEGKRAELRARVANDDPGAFLTWPTIVSTMFVADAPYIRDEWDVLYTSGEWGRWKQAVTEDDSGSPTRLPEAPWTSGNMIHQAYHLLRWEQYTGRRIAGMKSIIEIGGGYGAMAKVAHRAGFEGKYLIVDVPEFSLLQEYYLSQCGVEVETKTQLDRKHSPSLLIAMWSLDEMGDLAANSHLDLLRPANVLAAAHSAEIAIGLAARLKAERIEISHLPSNFYLLR